jgi:AraC-like DNA-binding protein
MDSTSRKSSPPIRGVGSDSNKGLFRAILAGPGHTLADAFANLERAPHVERLWRHEKRDLLGARIALPPDEGKGYWEFTRIRDEIYVIVENFAYKDPRLELVTGDGLVQLYFRLAGDLTLAVSRTEPLRLTQPSLLVWNQPSGLDIDEWTAPDVHERCVAITMRPQYLLEHFVSSGEPIPSTLRAFLGENLDHLNYCQLPLTAQMFELAMKLVNNPFQGMIGLIYTESLANELICHTIKGFETISTAPNEQYSASELRSLHAARSLLMRQFSPVPTIRQVARSAGINEGKLKRGFKAIFGETMFHFGTRCRMQHALTLLRDRKLPVARVAEAVGYRHQSTFATAFFRQFGMRPKDAGKGKRL